LFASREVIGLLEKVRGEAHAVLRFRRKSDSSTKSIDANIGTR
jgi:hypothetical protein